MTHNNNDAGLEFGPQFGVAVDRETLPTLILVDTLTNPYDDTIRIFSAEVEEVGSKAPTVSTVQKWIKGSLTILNTTRQKYWGSFATALAEQESGGARASNASHAGTAAHLDAAGNASAAAAPAKNAFDDVGPRNMINSTAPRLLSKQKPKVKGSFAAWKDYTNHLERLVTYSNYAKRVIKTAKNALIDYSGQQHDAEALLEKASALFSDAHHKYPLFALLVNNTVELEAIMADDDARRAFRGKIELASRQGQLLAKKGPFADEIVEADVWLATEMSLLLKGEEARFAARTDVVRDAQHAKQPTMPEPAACVPPPSVVQPVTIDRRDWRSLTLEEFYTEYAQPKKPVIITNLKTSTVPWTLAHIRTMCSNGYAELQKRDPNTTNWGGLVGAEILNIGDFIDTHSTNETRSKYYLHDWSLPRNCPKIFGPAPYTEFRMPKYVCTIQRTCGSVLFLCYPYSIIIFMVCFCFVFHISLLFFFFLSFPSFPNSGGLIFLI